LAIEWGDWLAMAKEQLTMTRALTIWMAAALVLLGGGAQAQERKAQAQTSVPVLELFTSQGCSSCPAADAVFQSYAARRDIVALSMPVDYWDYLGWKDTLAQASFSKRQRSYAKARGDGQVYTPQVVVNGRRHIVGTAHREIEATLKDGNAPKARVTVSAEVANDVITIDVAALSGADTNDLSVWLISVRPEALVDIKAGENRGKKLKYFNVVREMAPLGPLKGPAVKLQHPLPSTVTSAGDRIAVLVQDGIGGAIVHAAWVR
jgi:hypothetical protein